MRVETLALLARPVDMDVSLSYYEYQPAAHLLVTDEDAADFLQSQFSNDLRPFQAGQATYGLWLDVKGKVIADSVILCEGAERFRVLSERCAGEQIATHLERHIIADEVSIESGDPGYAVELTADGLRALNLDLPETGKYTRVKHGCLLRAQEDHYIIWCESILARDALRQNLKVADLVAVSSEARGMARMVVGRPLVPDEIGPADLPGEGELTGECVSLTKGCYLGQEVVARMHNIGKAQRRLFVLGGKGASPETPCPLHNAEGKAVGELRTAYAHADAWNGVALLKTRFVQPGSLLLQEANEVYVMYPLREGARDE
jgi:folate-binding protein YgfZ